MPLYLDVHNRVPDLTEEALADAHQKDLATQNKYGVKYLRYWYDEGTGKVFCLVEAPSKEAAAAVHREAHGMWPMRYQRGEGRPQLRRRTASNSINLPAAASNSCGNPLTRRGGDAARSCGRTPTRPPHLAERSSNRARLGEERKRVTVLFADMWPSAAAADRDPEEGAELDAVLERRWRSPLRGTVNQGMGDGIWRLRASPMRTAVRACCRRANAGERHPLGGEILRTRAAPRQIRTAQLARWSSSIGAICA
jgi:hypothetical protein